MHQQTHWALKKGTQSKPSRNYTTNLVGFVLGFIEAGFAMKYLFCMIFLDHLQDLLVRNFAQLQTQMFRKCCQTVRQTVHQMNQFLSEMMNISPNVAHAMSTFAKCIAEFHRFDNFH